MIAHPLEHLNGPIYRQAMSRIYSDAQTKADTQLKPKSAEINMAMVGEHNEL